MGVEHSIIIPMYNAENTIERCVNSVLKQTIDNIEIILVDDGSSDATLVISKRLQERDQRIIVLHQQNRGVSSARNKGLNRASGKYVYFIDSDDYVDETYIENLNKSNSELVVAAYKIENYNGECQLLKRYPHIFFRTMNHEVLKEYIIMGMFNYPVAKRFLKSIISEQGLFFDPTLQIAEDTDFVTSYLCFSQDVEIISATDYHYIKGGAGTSLSTQRLSEKFIDNIECAQDCIYNKLFRLFGTEAEVIITKRIAPLYKDFIAEIITDDIIDRELLKHIYKKKWFKEALNNENLFKDENVKFQFIMKLKSPTILLLYLKYVQHKKIC